jgi:hypothetical protein
VGLVRLDISPFHGSYPARALRLSVFVPLECFSSRTGGGTETASPVAAAGGGYEVESGEGGHEERKQSDNDLAEIEAALREAVRRQDRFEIARFSRLRTLLRSVHGGHSGQGSLS